MKTLCEMYTRILSRHHIAETDPGRRNDIEGQRAHMIWHLRTIPAIDDATDQDLCLGFVQGWMWGRNIRNTQEFADDIREMRERVAKSRTLIGQ